MFLPCRGESSFFYSLSASLFLHSCIIVFFVLIGRHAQVPLKRSTLQIELCGVVTDRQREEKMQRHAPSRPHQPRQTRRARRIPEMYKTAMSESTVHVSNTEGKAKTDEQAIQPTPPMQASAPLPGASGAGNADRQQRQQTIGGSAEQESERIRKYLARLAKLLRNNLAYPEDVRKHGVEGVSTIAFTVTKSGDIKGDSLRVKKSSGYAALDSSALRSARASAPFEKPPKELNVSIAVSFTVEMARPRAKQAAAL